MGDHHQAALSLLAVQLVPELVLPAERLAAGNSAVELTAGMLAAVQDDRPAVTGRQVFCLEAEECQLQCQLHISLLRSDLPMFLSGDVLRCKAVYLSLHISPQHQPGFSKRQHCATLCAPVGFHLFHGISLLLQV